MKNKMELPDQDPLAQTAERIVSDWLMSSGADTTLNECISLPVLEAYRAGRASTEEKALVQNHVLHCVACSDILACMHRAVRSENGVTHWRIAALRPLLELQSEWAEKERNHIRVWLTALETKSPDDVKAFDIQVPLETPNGSDFLIRIRSLIPATIDVQGRLVITLVLETPPQIPLQLTISLATPMARLELFTTTTEEPYLEAIVDLSHYVSKPLSLSSKCFSIKVAAEDVPVLTAPPITFYFEHLTAPRSIDLVAVDTMLVNATVGQLNMEVIRRDIAISVCLGRTIAAIARAADLQARYVKMWRIGNSGDIPEEAVILLTDIVCILEELPSEAREEASSLQDSASTLSSLNLASQSPFQHTLSEFSSKQTDF